MQFRLVQYRGLIALTVTWIAVVALFAILVGNKFISLENFETIARQTTIVGFGAIGMTFVIMSGAIDLSVGAVVALVTVVIAWLLDQKHPTWLAASAGIAAGIVCSYLSGIVITKLRVSSFIVTLSGFLVFRGLAKGLAGEQKIDAPLTWLTELLAKLPPDRSWMLLPIGVWMLLFLSVICSFLLQRTILGRNVIAVGANETAAALCGINAGRVRRIVFALSGFCIGIAGLMQFSRLTVGDPTVAQGLELEIIAATVIGGASLSGGEGSIVGSLLGALIMSTIRAGCSQYGLPNWVQEIVTGVIILCAVWVDRARSRSSAIS